MQIIYKIKSDYNHDLQIIYKIESDLRWSHANNLKNWNWSKFMIFRLFKKLKTIAHSDQKIRFEKKF